MTMGIYQITLKVNNKVYIGSSCNIEKRWNQHRSFLNSKRMDKTNPFLYNSWQKYGENNFVFEILEITEKQEDLLSKEQKWLDKYKLLNGQLNRDKCFNILPTAGSNLGFKASDTTKQKMSDSHYGEQAINTHLTNQDAIEIKQLLNTTKISYKELMQKYNISMSCLRNIVINRSWKRVGEKVERKGNSKRKFNDREVIEIRNRYNNNESQQDIADSFNVSQMTISRIVRYKTYKNI